MLGVAHAVMSPGILFAGAQSVASSGSAGLGTRPDLLADAHQSSGMNIGCTCLQ